MGLLEEILKSIEKTSKEISESTDKKNKESKESVQLKNDYSLLPQEEFFDFTKPISFEKTNKKESK